MVWAHWEYLSDYELKLYDHDTGNAQQLIDDRKNDRDPEIDGSLVVWESWNGGDGEIIVYDIANAQKTNLTNNSEIDGWPDISGTEIVWQGRDGSDYEILLAVLEANIPGE